MDIFPTCVLKYVIPYAGPAPSIRNREESL